MLALLLALAAIPQHELRYDDDIRRAIAEVRDVFPVPLSLVRAVIKQESGFRPGAISPAGAVGLMQVMPFNATKLRLRSQEELLVPRLNILAGVRLLAILLKHYEGDAIAALVAYNAGPRAKGELPSNGETPEYVLRILHYWRLYRAEELPPAEASR